MSKAKRSKTNRSEALNRQLETAHRKKQQERRQNLIGILAVLCGLAVIAVVYFSVAFYNNGTVMRRRISMQSEHYKINNCMLSYYVYEQYRAFVNENYDQLDSTYKLDSKKSLKKQSCTLMEGSWYDYFLLSAEKDIKTLLLYAEAAADAGMKLEAAEQKKIDARIEKLQSHADAQSYTDNKYYEFMYGRGVREQDLRDCFALEALAEKYKQVNLYDAFVYTDAQLNDVYTKEPKAHAAVDYLSVNITPKDLAGDDTQADGKAMAAEWAEKFKSVSSVNDFKIMAKQYAEVVYRLEKIDANLIEMLKISTYDTVVSAAYTDDEAGNLLFDSRTKEGAVFVCGTADTQFTAYCVTKPLYKPTYATKNIGLIPFSTTTFGSADTAQNYAQKALAAWKENPTKEQFATLAETYSSDYSITKNEGIVENVKHAQLTTAVNEWIFAENRKKNDSTVIQSADGSYLVWYIDDGYIAWQSKIITDLYSDFTANHLAQLESKFTVTVNQKQMKKLSL